MNKDLLVHTIFIKWEFSFTSSLYAKPVKKWWILIFHHKKDYLIFFLEIYSNSIFVQLAINILCKGCYWTNFNFYHNNKKMSSLSSHTRFLPSTQSQLSWAGFCDNYFWFYVTELEVDFMLVGGRQWWSQIFFSLF